MEDFHLKELQNQYLNSDNATEKAWKAKELCDYYWKNSQYEKAHEIGLEGLKIANDLQDKDLLYELNTSIGINVHVQGHYVSAKKCFEVADSIAEEIRNPLYMIRSTINLGNSAYHLYDHVESLALYQKGVLLSEEYNELRYLPRLYNNIGNSYSDLKQFDKALEYYKKSLRITKESTNYANLHFNIGNLYMEKLDYALALGYFKKAKRLFKELNQYHYYIHSIDYIGKVFLLRHDYQNALISFKEAYSLCEEFNLLHSKESVLLSLADTYIKLNDFDKAEECFLYFLQKNEKFDYKRTQVDFYQGYINFNKQKDNIPLAFQYMEKLIALKDELFNEEIAKQSSLITAKFEYEQNKKELQIINLKNIELVKYQKVIEQQKDELIALSKSKDSILSMISHDLKNYIGSISSILEIAYLKDKSFKDNKYIGLISNICDKSVALVKDILFLNRIECDDFNLELKKYNINTELQHMKENLSLLADKKDIKLILEITNEESSCLLNIESFYRIIDNLFMNAVKFTQPGGEIYIKTSIISIEENLYYRIHVIDTGIGIPESIIPQLFEKHSTPGRRGTQGEESTGLGLFIVKRLLDLHHGLISVQSVEGQGSEFIISFPILVSE